MSTYISLFSTKLLVPRAEKHFMCKESIISVWWLRQSISVMLEHLVINISHQKALIEMKRFNKSNFLVFSTLILMLSGRCLNQQWNGKFKTRLKQVLNPSYHCSVICKTFENSTQQILAIFFYFANFHTFWCTFIGLNSTVVHQNLQISGIWSSSYNSTSW